MKAYWRLTRKYFKTIFRCCKKEAVLLMVKAAADGIVPCIQVYVLAQLIDTFTVFVQSGTQKAELAGYAAMLLLMVAYSWMSGRLGAVVSEKMNAGIRENYCMELTEKCARIRYDLFECKKTQDKVKRALTDTQECLAEIWNSVISLCVLAVQALGIIVLVAVYSWISALLMLLCMIPLVYLSVANGRVTYRTDRELAADVRKKDYYMDILTTREFAEERNIFEYSGYIEHKWKRQYEIWRGKSIRAFMQYFIKVKLFGVLMVALSLAMILILAWETVKQTLSIGLFMSITGNQIAFVQICTTNLVQLIKTYVKNMEKFMEFEEIFQMEEEDTAGSDGMIDFERIEFRHVSFCYPGTEKKVLDDMSFTIHAGKHYAIVGENGAGKTTVFKILTGLYTDYQGEVLIDGRELREFPLDQIRRMSSVVFQDFAKYGVSVRENLELGNGFAGDVKSVLKDVGLWERVSQFEKKEETVLRKFENENEDFSGGQWQKLSIARTLISKAPLRMLDEMAASLDPISELKMYQEYERLSMGKTTVYITHRLGSVHLADCILVIDGGAVAEMGSHEELMARDGKYAEMYRTQRGMYL